MMSKHLSQKYWNNHWIWIMVINTHCIKLYIAHIPHQRMKFIVISRIIHSCVALMWTLMWIIYPITICNFIVLFQMVRVQLPYLLLTVSVHFLSFDILWHSYLLQSCAKVCLRLYLFTLEVCI